MNETLFIPSISVNGIEELRKESETQILARILNEPKEYTANSKNITEEIFFNGFNRNVFNSFKKILESGKKADAISISDDLKIHNENSSTYVGNSVFDALCVIVENLDYNINIESSVDFLRDEYKRNKLSAATTKFYDAILNHKPIEEIEKINTEEIATVFLQNIDNKPKHIKEFLYGFTKFLEKNGQKKEVSGVGTGFTLFDNFSGGFQPSDLIILAGRTSHGKTSMAVTIANNASQMFNKKVAILSLEMNTNQIISRLMSQRTGISSKKILIEKLNSSEFIAINKAITTLEKSNIYLDECSSTSLTNIVSQMQYLHITQHIDLFVIDYLQLINHFIKGGNKEQQTAFIARRLKNFAKETNTSVLLLSQCNRSDNNKSKPPTLSDLRDSGQIEEAADIVIFTWMPFTDGVMTFPYDNSSTEGRAQINIAKGRNIGIAQFYLDFHKELTLFANQGTDINHKFSKNDTRTEEVPF